MIKLGENVDYEAVESNHMLALHVAQEVFNQQSQPLDLEEGNGKGIVINLRVNLRADQAEQLLVKPLQRALGKYEITHDVGGRKLNVSKKQEKKTPGRPRKTPD